ncbi:hypothetical protein E2C01_086908 [Portunus trituberculatus]|uniref:Uncharacterized protein n=1 Tax=Portunus trituberculatus TaxID=210409 RepID=A0A5B7JEQ4_PORTR|nr:hypothetical protein [Portunus trituberculatus]
MGHQELRDSTRPILPMVNMHVNDPTIPYTRPKYKNLKGKVLSSAQTQ